MSFVTEVLGEPHLCDGPARRNRLVPETGWDGVMMAAGFHRSDDLIRLSAWRDNASTG